MKTMTYKGYTTSIRYSEDDGCFVGEITGIHDVVSFHGATMADLLESFKESVDDYLETCLALGRRANLPACPTSLQHPV